VSAAVTPPVSPALRQPSSDGTRPRRRWEVWRSPAGQPGWARPALLSVAALAAVLYAWNIASVDLAPYYSVAVKSMSESWKAFFYGAFDPAATITIDKLPGAFLPQALSARIFGFHPWSLALPQVVEGVVTVLVIYRAVRQWAGEVPGLLAALLLTLTPISASVFGPANCGSSGSAGSADQAPAARTWDRARSGRSSPGCAVRAPRYRTPLTATRRTTSAACWAGQRFTNARQRDSFSAEPARARVQCPST
jgi:hypothetical protein